MMKRSILDEIINAIAFVYTTTIGLCQYWSKCWIWFNLVHISLFQHNYELFHSLFKGKILAYWLFGIRLNKYLILTKIRIACLHPPSLVPQPHICSGKNARLRPCSVSLTSPSTLLTFSGKGFKNHPIVLLLKQKPCQFTTIWNIFFLPVKTASG